MSNDRQSPKGSGKELRAALEMLHYNETSTIPEKDKASVTERYQRMVRQGVIHDFVFYEETRLKPGRGREGHITLYVQKKSIF